MIFRKYILLVLMLAINYTYGQNEFIITPTVASPEQIFNSIIEKEKLENPVLLNGEVQSVYKKVIEYRTPNRAYGTQKNYSYNLNKQKQVVTYSSDVEFDEMTPQFLNLDKEVHVKGDTLINQGDFWYTFKKGKLIARTEESDFMDVFVDSISFKYRENKLIEIKHYKRDIVIDVNMDNNGVLIEDTLLYSDYEMTNYSSGNYNKNNLLESKLEVFTFEDYIFTDHTTYKYNHFGKLVSFKRISENFEVAFFDMFSFIKNRTKHNLKRTPFETEQYTGVYTYDDKNRTIKFETENVEEGKHAYNIEYHKNKITATYTNKGELELQYEYMYDNNNPIEEKIYTYINGIKYLDTFITLDIKYFK